MQHIDMAMDFSHDRATRYSLSLYIPGQIIPNIEFFRAIIIEYRLLQFIGNEYALLEWVIRLSSSIREKSWEGCTHMYIPVIVNHHCIALEIVVANSTIYVYDPDHSYLTQWQLKLNLELVAMIVPLMARQAGLTVRDKLTIARDMTTTRQSISFFKIYKLVFT